MGHDWQAWYEFHGGRRGGKVDSVAARKAALARRGEARPCRVCRRPTLAPSGVCDRHQKKAR